MKTRWFVLLAALLAGPGIGQPSARDDAREIRALRAQSNAAIARHDFPDLRAFMLPDYMILPGSAGTPLDIDQLEQRIAAIFDDPTFITYVRTPQRIFIGDSRRRAAETGRWVGTWRKLDGMMRLSGVYLATWMPTAQGWRLKNEIFVTLRCSGSRACSEIPR